MHSVSIADRFYAINPWNHHEKSSVILYIDLLTINVKKSFTDEGNIIRSLFSNEETEA